MMIDPLQDLEPDDDDLYEDCITCGEHQYDPNDDICHSCGFKEEPDEQ